MTDNSIVELSIVIPVLNEVDSLKSLHEEIAAAVSGSGNCEIIFIDDGSTDESLNILIDIQENDARVRVIKLRRNFGQTAALSAGFRHARG